MGKIVLVGGASGVGKTTLCATVVNLGVGTGLKLFHKIQEKAEKLRISRQDKIKNWSNLGKVVFTEEVFPFIKQGPGVVVDMHYAFQSQGGTFVAFAKRGFRPEIPCDCTLGNDWTHLMAGQNIIVVTILLWANPKLIQERQGASGYVLLPVETILAEQVAEEKAWVSLNSSLSELRVRIMPIRIENIKKPEETGQWLRNQLDAGN